MRGTCPATNPKKSSKALASFRVCEKRRARASGFALSLGRDEARRNRGVCTEPNMSATRFATDPYPLYGGRSEEECSVPLKVETLCSCESSRAAVPHLIQGSVTPSSNFGVLCRCFLPRNCPLTFKQSPPLAIGCLPRSGFDLAPISALPGIAALARRARPAFAGSSRSSGAIAVDDQARADWAHCAVPRHSNKGPAAPAFAASRGQHTFGRYSMPACVSGQASSAARSSSTIKASRSAREANACTEDPSWSLASITLRS